MPYAGLGKRGVNHFALLKWASWATSVKCGPRGSQFFHRKNVSLLGYESGPVGLQFCNLKSLSLLGHECGPGGSQFVHRTKIWVSFFPKNVSLIKKNVCLRFKQWNVRGSYNLFFVTYNFCWILGSCPIYGIFTSPGAFARGRTRRKGLWLEQYGIRVTSLLPLWGFIGKRYKSFSRIWVTFLFWQ